MKRKLTKKTSEEPTSFEIEQVFLDNRKTEEDGRILVAVKWRGYDELTFEPIENVTEKDGAPEEEQPKESKKRPINAKKRKSEKGQQIDYMSHSLMPVTEEIALREADEKQDTCLQSGALSTVAPATAKRTNTSRARRENISIDEQIHRSAEMRDIVAQNTQSVVEVKPNLCYSSTDESDKATTVFSSNMPFVPVKPPPFIIMPPPVISQVPAATMATMFPYSSRKEKITENFSALRFSVDQPADNVALQRHYASKDSRISKAMREENWEENSALENADDEGTQPLPGAHVCHSTLSTEMQERNYKAYGINSFFRDTQFADDVDLERKLFGIAVRNLCRVNGEQDSSPEAVKRAAQQIENAGLGQALVSVHSLCANAQQRKSSGEPCNLLTAQFDYPLQSDIRCFHDQHRFTSIPIFIPLAFYPEREMVSILSSICFCSFSCAKSWIRKGGLSAYEQGSSVAHKSESDEIMLSIFARKYFGINEEIKYAAPLLLHEDNGGVLNTKQWRALGTTHRSILRQPLCVAAPSTIIAEVYVRSKDAGKVARIVRRTEETHFAAIPERPERNSADAAEAAKRKLKEGEGRPLKQRQTIDAQGNRVTLDDEQLEKRIQAGAVKRGQKKTNTLVPKGMQAGVIKQAKLSSDEPARKKQEPAGVAKVMSFQ